MIPKATDEYLQQLDAYNRARAGRNSANPLDNPVWSVHGGEPPAKGSPVSFSLLLEPGLGGQRLRQGDPLGLPRAAICRARRPQSEPLLDRLAGYAIHYYEDFVLPGEAVPRRRRARARRLRRPGRAAAGAARRLRRTAKLIQNEVYAAGKAAGFEPLRDWFQALYEVLLGQSQGPRFGSFAAIFGLDRTIALIERALAGEDLSAA